MLGKLILRVGLGLLLAAGGGAVSGGGAALAEPAVPADAGDLDLTFGGFGAGGRLVGADFPGTQMYDSVTLLDGSYIVAGTDGQDFIAVHALTNGQLDPDFGVAGVARVDFGAGETANSVALDEEGRILLAGTTSTGGIFGTSNFAVARLNSDGTPDNSFDLDGKVTVDFNGKRDSAQVILPYTHDNTVHVILVAGSAQDSSGSTTNMAFAHLDSAGALDGGFGAGGKLETAMAGDEVATALVTNNNGELFAGGFQTAPTPSFVMTAFYYNGNPDNTFGASSVLTGITLTTLLDLAWQDFPGGTLLATGAAGGDVGVMAVTNQGAPVMSFSADGLATVDFGGADLPKALLSAIDDTVAVAGSSGTRLGLARFSKQGDLLLGSPALTDLAAQGASETTAVGLSLVSDIRLMTLGSIQAGADRRLALTRHFIDLSPDAGGRQGTDFGNTTGDPFYSNNSDQARTAVFQPDGRLIVGGYSDPEGTRRVAVLARYTTDGQRDPSFGNAGSGIVFQSALTETIGVVVLPFGQLILGDIDFNLMRLDSSGDQDLSFGTGGIGRANYPGAQAGALVRQSDGKLVLAGLHRTTPQAQPSVALARFTAEGQLDPGYNLDGRVLTGVGGFAAGLDAALTPEGKLVVAGVTGATVNQTATFDFLVIRYNDDGTPDDSFGSDGVVITDFGAGEAAAAVAVMSDGRIVVGGYSLTSGMAFARYLPNGQPDNSFSFDGKRLLQLTGHDITQAIALQGDKIVATDCDGVAKTSLVVRLTGAGSLDTSFNGTGSAPFAFTADDCVSELALAPGRFAAAGSAKGVGNTLDFAVAVYESPFFPMFLPVVVR